MYQCCRVFLSTQWYSFDGSNQIYAFLFCRSLCARMCTILDASRLRRSIARIAVTTVFNTIHVCTYNLIPWFQDSLIHSLATWSKRWCQIRECIQHMTKASLMHIKWQIPHKDPPWLPVFLLLLLHFFYRSSLKNPFTADWLLSSITVCSSFWLALLLKIWRYIMPGEQKAFLSVIILRLQFAFEVILTLPTPKAVISCLIPTIIVPFHHGTTASRVAFFVDNLQNASAVSCPLEWFSCSMRSIASNQEFHCPVTILISFHTLVFHRAFSHLLFSFSFLEAFTLGINSAVF